MSSSSQVSCIIGDYFLTSSCCFVIDMYGQLMRIKDLISSSKNGPTCKTGLKNNFNNNTIILYFSLFLQ